MNRKASYQDFVFAIVFIFSMIIVVVIGNFFLSAWSTEFTASDAVPQSTKDEVNELNEKWNPTFDAAIIFWFFILWVAGIALAFYNDTSTVFFVVYIIMALLTFFILGGLGVFLQSLENTPLYPTLESMPMTLLMIRYWMAFVAFYAVTLGFALYSKRRVTEGY